MPQRIQRKRTKGFKLPPGTLCINRPSPFGNPYRVKEHGRAGALALFEEYLAAMPDVLRALRLARIRQADYLACFCRLDEACHGDIWLRYAEAGTTKTLEPREK